MAGDQRLQLEFIVGVEAAGGRGDLLTQQPIGADDPAVVRPGQSRIDHQKVVAKHVETVGIALFDGMDGAAPRTELVIEDAEAHFLRGGHFLFTARQPDLKGSDAAEDRSLHEFAEVAAGPPGWARFRMIVSLLQCCVHGMILLRAARREIRGQCNRRMTLP